MQYLVNSSRTPFKCSDVDTKETIDISAVKDCILNYRFVEVALAKFEVMICDALLKFGLVLRKSMKL